jgi:O-antigen/teichoic acid export membrane protein
MKTKNVTKNIKLIRSADRILPSEETLYEKSDMRARCFSHQVSWAAAGQALSLIASLIAMKVWAVYLVPAELGLMALTIGLASILVGVIVGPVTQAILVSYAAHSAKGNIREFRTVAGAFLRKVAAIVATLIVITGTPLALYLGIHWATPLAVAGLFLVDAVRAFEHILLAAARRQREVAVIDTCDVWFRLVFVWLFLIAFKSSGYVAIAGNLVGAIAFLVTMPMILKLEAFPGIRPVADTMQNSMRDGILRLARPLFPSSILANLTEMGNRYLIGATIGVGAAGIFVVSYGLVKRPYGLLNHVFTMTMTPMLSNAIVTNDINSIRRIRCKWITFVSILSALGVILFFLLKKPIVMVLLSEQYSIASDLFLCIAIAVSIYNVCNVICGFLITMGNTHGVLITNIVGCIVTLSLTIVLCLQIGISGAVWALLSGYFVQFITSILIFRTSSKRCQLYMIKEAQKCNLKEFTADQNRTIVSILKENGN